MKARGVLTASLPPTLLRHPTPLAAAAVGASLARAHVTAVGSVEPPVILAAYREAAGNLRSAELALRAVDNPAVMETVERIVSISPGEYAELVDSVSLLADPDLRKWLLLDSPEIQEGLESLRSGVGVEELKEFAADAPNLIAGAARDRFVEGLSRFGGNLVAIATGTGATGVQFFSVWGDDCSPEGAKQNCMLNDIVVTLAVC